MREVQIRGTTDPAEIAVVLALLRRDGPSTPSPRGGVAAWRTGRRAALSPHPHRRGHRGSIS